jgi:hypothetical protein
MALEFQHILPGKQKHTSSMISEQKRHIALSINESDIGLLQALKVYLAIASMRLFIASSTS